MNFALAIHKDPGSEYGVTVPDVPGCFAAGATIKDAITDAEKAIIAHFTTLLELGEEIPRSPSSIEEHMNNPEFSGAIWATVEVDLAAMDPAPERVNISVPRFALAAIDRYAKEHGKTRSGLLVESAMRAISS